MILLDDRVGSRHLQPLIKGSELARLEAGDACFGAVDGRLVGVEVKTVNDAVSCMYSGRLADHQIPLMSQLYDVRYLVIQGTYRPEPDTGVLQLWREFDSTKEVRCGKWIDVQSGRKRLMYSQFECWLASVSLLSGTLVRNTTCSHSTAALLSALYSWWQRDSHKSFDVMHTAEGNAAVLSRPTMLRYMIARLPHVGWIRSAELQRRIGAVQFIRRDGKPMRAEDWYIEREIAAKSAEDIMRACDGEGD